LEHVALRSYVPRMDNASAETSLTVRVPVALVSALDAEAERRRAANPGIKITRADCVRALLLGALPSTTAGSAK
jgi:hypothetical protein